MLSKPAAHFVVNPFKSIVVDVRRIGIVTALIVGLGCQVRGQVSENPLAQAEILIGQEEFAKAEQLLLTARREQPANMEALYRLGYVQFRHRKLGEARQSFSAVVAAAPPAY